MSHYFFPILPLFFNFIFLDSNINKQGSNFERNQPVKDGVNKFLIVDF